MRDARRMGLMRYGAGSVATLRLVAADVHTRDDAPRTLGADPLTPPPWTVDADALRSSLTARVQSTGERLGIAVNVPAGGPVRWDGHIPDDTTGLLAATQDGGSEGALALRVHVGWCPIDGAWAACVRSPDTALGVGPPGVEGFVLSRLRTKKRGVVATRTTVVEKRFVYTIDDDTRAHLDRPFIGVGDTPTAQAQDAIGQAVDAWMTVYLGGRGVRRLTRER